MPYKFENYLDRVFPYLTVVAEAPKVGQSRAWICVCICGNQVIKTSGALKRNGNGASCGCIPNGYKHGMSYEKHFLKWSVIKSRCYNKKDKGYNNYGGRGITMCDEWLNNYYSFHEWVEDNYVKGMTIDRIDNQGPYAPWNCRYASHKTQANNRRSNKYYTYNGLSKTLSEWAMDFNIKEITLRNRIKAGWTLENALILNKQNGKRCHRLKKLEN